MAKRYYWLKLNENFFEREEIKLVEAMQNGKDYILFYMKLLLKSIQHEGKLLFREVIPYTPDMLATLTNTNVDVAKTAIKLFCDLRLMEMYDNGTLFMVETQNMIGSEGESASRVRKLREERKQQQLLPEKALQCNTSVTKGNKNVQKSNTDIRYRDKSIEKDDVVTPENFYNNNIALINPHIAEEIKCYIEDDGIEEALIVRLMEKAVDMNKANWAYIKAAIDSNKKANRLTLEDYEVYESTRKNKSTSTAKPRNLIM